MPVPMKAHIGRTTERRHCLKNNVVLLGLFQLMDLPSLSFHRSPKASVSSTPVKEDVSRFQFLENIDAALEVITPKIDYRSSALVAMCLGLVVGVSMGTIAP